MNNIGFCFAIIFTILIIHSVLDIIFSYKHEKRLKRIEKHLGLVKQKSKDNSN